MKQFIAKTFNIPKLKGISEKNIEEHLKLYQGYVKNANSLLEQVEMLKKESEKNAYLLGELMRRFSFEFNGMRNHELYFSQFDEEWGSFDQWLAAFKMLGLTRGIGWAMLWFDRRDKRFLMSWVDEQHLGQLNDCAIILALDMWEHAYVADYQPSGKKQCIEDFFSNLNWGVVEKGFRKVSI